MIPNIMISTNNVMSIPVPFSVIIDDELIWLTADGRMTVKAPNRIRSAAPIKQKQMPILLPPVLWRA